MHNDMDKNPKVSIVMAIYKPRIDWFIEQLNSLDNQTYNNINLYILNDYPDGDDELYKKIISDTIKRIEYHYYRNDVNLGPTGTFERLTIMADGDYIAYCDQDDIWIEDKIEKLINYLNDSKADLVFSDMYIINSNSRVISDSITKVRPLHRMYDMEDFFCYLLKHSIVLGCTMIVSNVMAKKSLPIPNESGYVYHDWWISIYAAAYGKIRFLNHPLIKYRIHDHNVTEFLKEIKSKASYVNRLISFNSKMLEVKKRIINTSYQNSIDKIYAFGRIRYDYYNEHSLKNFIKMLGALQHNYRAISFEILLPVIPNKIFNILINSLKNYNY